MLQPEAKCHNSSKFNNNPNAFVSYIMKKLYSMDPSEQLQIIPAYQGYICHRCANELAIELPIFFD